MRPGDPVIGERETARAAAILVVSLSIIALIGVITVKVHGGGRGFLGVDGPATIGLCAAGLIGAVGLLLRPSVLAPRRLPVGLAVAAVFLTVATWWAGPVLGPYVAMSYIWVGIAAHLFFRRAMAFVVVAWVGACYAVLLIAQEGNEAPVTRWILVLGAVTVSGLLFGQVSDRIHHLVAEERRLRSELEAASRELEVAHRHRSDFLAGMSHELRTPLNAVIGFADILAERLFGPLSDAQARVVSDVRAAGMTLLELAGEVLDLDADDPAEAPTVNPSGHRGLPQAEPIIRADPRGAAAFFLLAPAASLTLPHTPLGFDLGAALVLAAIGLALDMWVLLGPGIPDRLRPTLHITLVTLAALAVAFAAGPHVSPFVSMFFLWMATASVIRFSPRMAAAQLILIAVCEALLVTLQHGNSAPFFRWEDTTGTSVATALAMRAIVARLLDAAAQEADMRRGADEAGADLAAAERHKVEFLGNIREEIRAPVDEVTEAAERLVNGSLGPLEPKQAEYAADIVSAGRHLWDLITDILDLATLESGRMPLQQTELDLGDVVHWVVAAYDDAASASGVHLDLDPAPDRIRLRADGDKLRRAVAGLVSNAVKFTPPGGRVTVRARILEGQVTIAVADTGPGIPVEDQARIFEGFQQGRPAAAAPGTGVGLTLARRFVQLQGGRVELESVPGAGSTFTITLPGGDPAIESPGGATTLTR